MSNYIEEEITLVEFADRFIGLNNLSEPNEYDTEALGVEVLTLDSNGEEVYKPIQSFVVKEMVDSYYTDGKIKVSGNHRFIEGGSTVFAKDHVEFNKICGDMYVVDIEVADLHSYLANGRLNHNTTSGGKSLAFHSSVRLRLKNMGQIKAKVGGQERIIGMKVRCQVIKNRMGPPLRSADFDIFFDRGIDNYGSWLSVLKDNNLVKQSGAWYTYVDETTGEELRFQSKDFVELLETRDDLREQIYNNICNSCVLAYRGGSTAHIDDYELEVDTGIDDE
jgi:hypothetical protein